MNIRRQASVRWNYSSLCRVGAFCVIRFLDILWLVFISPFCPNSAHMHTHMGRRAKKHLFTKWFVLIVACAKLDSSTPNTLQSEIA